MTRTFLATDSNDLAVNMAGNLSVISSVTGIGQVARQAMQTRRNEMIFDMPEGIPFDLIAWDGSANLAQFEAAARKRFRQVAGVKEVLSFEASMNVDVLQYVAVLLTDQGEVTING